MLEGGSSALLLSPAGHPLRVRIVSALLLAALALFTLRVLLPESRAPVLAVRAATTGALTILLPVVVVLVTVLRVLSRDLLRQVGL